MEDVLSVSSIVTRFGTQVVHDGVSFAVRRGEVVGLIGGSGSGKSVLLREIIGLMRPTGGAIELLGTDVAHAGSDELNALRRRFGDQNGLHFAVIEPGRLHDRAPQVIFDHEEFRLAVRQQLQMLGRGQLVIERHQHGY